MANEITLEQCNAELEELKARLYEAEETIRAIREGEVDALVVSGPEGDQIYTLRGAERAYRLLVEAMNEGALVLTFDGTIAYSNRTFAAMLGVPLERIVNSSIFQYIADDDVDTVKNLLVQAQQTNSRAEVGLKSHGMVETTPVYVSIGNLELDQVDMLSAVMTDLTGHKKVEAELETYRLHLEELVEQRTLEVVEANRRTASILESIGDGFVSYDKEWRYTYLNDIAEASICELTGCRKADLIGKNMWELFPDLVNTSVYAEYHRAVAEQTPVRFDNYREDEGRWYHVSAYPGPDGLSVFFEDITERKQIEEEIHRSRQELKTITENLPDVVDRFDRELRHIFASPSIKQMTGKSYQEILGKTNRELNYPESLVSVSEEHLEKVFETGEEQSIEFDWETPEGLRSYQSRLVPEYDTSGNIISVLAVSRDITERKQMENALRDSERRYSALFSNKINGIAHCRIITDENGQPVDYTILQINEAYERIIGIKKSDIEGRRVTEVFPDIKSYAFNYIGVYGKIALEGGETKFEEYFEATGQYLSIYAYSPTAGEFDAIFTDVTEQKRAEQAMRDVLAREHRIADTLQKAMIPSRHYQVPCCDVAVKCEPASKEAEVGGDFFDIFDLGRGRVGVLIGDVSGKGLDAAIRVSAARHAVRSYAYLDPSPGKVLTLANNALCKDPVEGIAMITAFFAVVDTKASTVTCANGGHESPILCGADGTGRELTISGIALGVMEGYEYSEESINLKAGDTLVLVTDGITEARPDSQHLFGIEGVLKSVWETCGRSLDDVTTGLIDAAKEHAGGLLRDDAAIVALRLKPGALDGGLDVKSKR